MLLPAGSEPLTEQHGGDMTHALPSRQIVVGVDGSAASDAAVRWAVREARLRRITVHLVCAYHSDDRMSAPYAPQFQVRPDERYAAAQAYLDRAAALARRRLPPDRVLPDLVNEPSARALLGRSAGAEMLVLGATRPGIEPGQPALALGPVARACLRRAPCPVVVIAPDHLPDVPQPRRGTLATTHGRRSALAPRAPVPLG
jgi:nucleotide-binding universal stress UspA family protein